MVVPLTFKAIRSSCVFLTARSRRGVADWTCKGPKKPPPCPPCPPRRPPCRPRHPHPPTGIRIVCCPPRPVKPPPCIPTRCTLTCADTTTQHRSDSFQPKQLDEPRVKLTVGGQDIVARRLQIAARYRQLDYEREIALNADLPPPPREAPPAPYVIGGQREILRATDGRLYVVPRTCEERQRPHCSCDNIPPPSRTVTLEEQDHTCHIGEKYLDPCAHQPRVFIEIDRSASKPPCVTKTSSETKDTMFYNAYRAPTAKPCASTAPAAKPCISTPPAAKPCVSTPPAAKPCASTAPAAKPCVSTPPAAKPCASTTPTAKPCTGPSFTPSADDNNADTSKCAAVCPRSPRSSGRRVGDVGWCSNPPFSPKEPQICQPLTLVEYLRARSPRSAPRDPGQFGKRRLHTSYTVMNVGGLKEMLRAKEQLAESGRGRIVSDSCVPRVTPPESPAGKLEICVPSGTSKVRVNVFLEESDDGSCVTPRATSQDLDTCKSIKWLSIKNIQKKFTGCPSETTSGSSNQCPEISKSQSHPHRTKCPPPPLRSCHPAFTKPLSTSQCKKPT